MRLDALGIAFAALGSMLVLVGLGYRTPRLADWDAKIFSALNGAFNRQGTIYVFRAIWPLGSNIFALILLLLVLLNDARAGLLGLLLYSCTSVLEWWLKKSMNRRRPFLDMPDIAMLQPIRPMDPSFPSGDTLRAWFLAFSLPIILHLPWPYMIFFCVLALMIALERIALGAHYPLDIVGGAGIGLLAAGLYLFLLGMG